MEISQKRVYLFPDVEIPEIIKTKLRQLSTSANVPYEVLVKQYNQMVVDELAVISHPLLNETLEKINRKYPMKP